jgi:hypothetical protein
VAQGDDREAAREQQQRDREACPDTRIGPVESAELGDER